MNATKRIRVAMTAVAALLGWAVVPAGAYAYWHIWEVDQVEESDVGHYTSLAILPSGCPAISYFDVTNGFLQLKYAEYTAWHPVAGSWIPEFVDPHGQAYYGTSLAVVPDTGQPIISYFVGWANDDLRIARRDPELTGWVIETVPDPGIIVGEDSSLAFLPSGHMAISYLGDGHVRYAEWDGSQWCFTVVDPEPNVWMTSLEILPSGEPAISYFNWENGDLKYAWCDGDPCDPNDWHATTVDDEGEVGEYASLAIFPPDHPTLPGLPAISYYDATSKRLKFAWYDPNTPGEWQTTVVPCLLPYDVGLWTSLVIAPDGQPAISYFVAPLDARVPPGLYYASHTGSDLYTGWHWEVVDGGYDKLVGPYSSLAIFPADHPALPGVSAISYYDATNQCLKYALRHYCIGDLNCDGTIDFADINPFVLYLSNNAAWQAAYPGCAISNGDINLDGTFGQGSFGDINPFVGLMVECGAVGGCECPGPITPPEGCHGG